MIIRLWKLGSLEHKVIPTANAVNVLTDMIRRLNKNEPVADLVWDSAIDIELVQVDDSSMDVVTKDFVLSKEGVARIQEFVKSMAEETG